jgi:hypothetical protein
MGWEGAVVTLDLVQEEQKDSWKKARKASLGTLTYRQHICQLQADVEKVMNQYQL